MQPATAAVNTTASQPPVKTPKASWLRRLLRIGLILLLLLMAVVLTLPHTLPWLLQQQGIDFHWENFQWQRDGFSIEQIQFRQPSNGDTLQQLQLHHVTIEWAWQTFPIQTLRVARLQAEWPLNTQQTTSNDSALALPEALLKWLPQHIELQAIDANLVGMGHLHGSLNLHANEQGLLWQPSFIHSQLTLKDLHGRWLDSIPVKFQPSQLSAQISTHPDQQQHASDQQILAVDASSEGPMRLQLNGRLELQQQPSWQGALKNAQLTVQLDALEHPQLQAKQVHLQSYFAAQANSERFSISLNQGSTLEAHQLQFADIAQAQKATVDLSGLRLQGFYHALEQLDVHSPFTASFEQFNAAQLHPQSWQLSGLLSGQLPQIEATGQLTGEHGLSLSSQVQRLKDSLQGSVTGKEILFKSGNPLQKTFKDWPELVLLDSGRLRGQIDFTLPRKGSIKLALRGNVSGLNGIINRSELKNLSLDFNGQLLRQTLSLYLPSLSIDQLDPGIPLGPIVLTDGQYRTHLHDLLQGTASWQHVQANLLNGRAWLGPQQLDLSRPQQLLLQLEGLELQELFRVYPAEGLAGNGIIDGTLPIFIDQNTLYIEAGQLQARGPGVLQFQSEKIQALGRSNPAMAIVADALDDFHFNLLTSGLSYDQSGKLILDIRLEGQNPDVEKGRPIHLNVNLEDNIPALLASIQLSGQVSEIIQKRVRERLEQR